MPPYQQVADAILVAHALFIGFVVGGQVVIVAGLLRRWRWVRQFWFRLAHLGSIAVVVAQAWLGVLCPLTTWEAYFREKAGQPSYAGSFIQHWLHELIFYRADPWVFALAYSLFGLLVLATWVLGPPRRPGR